MFKHLRSALFLLQLSVLLNLLVILIVFLHFVLVPGDRDLKEAENNLALQTLLNDNFDVMNKNINNLGDAQMGAFQEVKESLDILKNSHKVIYFGISGTNQKIEDEGLKCRKEIKKLRGVIRKSDDNVKFLGDAQMRGFQEIDSVLTRNFQEINGTLGLNRGMFNYRLEEIKRTITDEVRNSCKEKK